MNELNHFNYFLLQKIWRGYKTRSQNNAELMKIRERTIKVNERALPENTLAEVGRCAIETLASNPSMMELIKVLTAIGK